MEQYQTSLKAQQVSQDSFSRSSTLIDPALIHTSYGVGVAGVAPLDGGPALGYADSPAHSEGTPSL